MLCKKARSGVKVSVALINGLCTRLLPDLYEPAFLGTGADIFHLRGIERLELDDGVCGVVQEWRCTPVR